jgi:hypothetical protein
MSSVSELIYATAAPSDEVLVLSTARCEEANRAQGSKASKRCPKPTGVEGQYNIDCDDMKLWNAKMKHSNKHWGTGAGRPSRKDVKCQDFKGKNQVRTRAKLRRPDYCSH